MPTNTMQARFDIELSPRTLHFVFLKSRHLVEDFTWPRFTLLGQSLGSMYLAWEAMTYLIPDLFIGRCRSSSMDPRTMAYSLLQTPWDTRSHSQSFLSWATYPSEPTCTIPPSAQQCYHASSLAQRDTQTQHPYPPRLS